MSLITATRRNETSNSINSARTQWGLSASASSVSVGTKATASDINTLLEYLRQAKDKSGWTGTVPSNVTVGTKITDILTSMITTANSIKNHCTCYGNCSGSCTGTCTGSCSGGCTNNCTASCRTNSSCNACYASGCGACGAGCGASGKYTPFRSTYYRFKVLDIRKYKSKILELNP